MEPTSASKPDRRITIADIARLYEEGERFATITAYDYPTARIVDEAGIPLILVGDSLGMVMLGYDTTVRVSIEEMLHHTRAVARGSRRALVVGDMPFLSYGVSEAESVEHAGRFSRRHTQASGGGRRPLGPHHRGHRQGASRSWHSLTPQAVNQPAASGSRPHEGVGAAAHRRCPGRPGGRRFAVVLELVPAALARAITERLRSPPSASAPGRGRPARSRS
jgi:3-methyl-2-oxobutanoate hydroxymethyltransferase